MISNPVRRALVAERQNTILAEAEAERRSKQLRSTRRRSTSPVAHTGLAVLPDGSPLVVRPVRGSDGAGLADGFARLSPASRRSRFLIGKSALTSAEVRYFTEVDHHDHEALAAISRVDGRGVGIARYIRNAKRPQTAEIAVTVVDEWQRRGLGTLLLTRLAQRACQEGIRRFTAMVAEDNIAMIGLLHRVDGKVDLLRREGHTLEFGLTHAHSRTPPRRLPVTAWRRLVGHHSATGLRTGSAALSG